MTNKTKILLAIFLTVLFVYPSISHAQNFFRPNVEIPGMGDFFTGSREVPVKVSSTSSTLDEMVTEYPIDGSGIIRYVSAIYSYAAVLAGVIAMFMLVFAAYQWMLAAGNAEKIGRAKDTISGTLLGLTLLFGGYLLLSQISTRLVVLVPIAVPKIDSKYLECSLLNKIECNNRSSCIWYDDEGICVDNNNSLCRLSADVVASNPENLTCCQQMIIIPQGYDLTAGYAYAIVSSTLRCGDVCGLEASKYWIEASSIDKCE